MSPAKKPSPASAAKKGGGSSKKRTGKIYGATHIYFFFCAIFLLQFVIVGIFLALPRGFDLPDLGGILHYKPAQTTIIYDSKGAVVDRIFTENRTIIPLKEMPPWLPLAFVAAEDGDFFSHKGVDFFSIFRAFFHNLLAGRRKQGGSTITQQIVKSLLLSPEKTYLRKIKEAVLAFRIDHQLSKEQILHIYLNQIYLGAGAYGVEAAAQIYFGKSATELTLGESALLAGLPQAPSRYSLFTHQKEAGLRQRYVLNRMVADGYISADAARRAYGQPVHLNRDANYGKKRGSYYLEEVKKRARAILGQPLQRAGVKIYTCLDSHLQKQAEKAVREGVAHLPKIPANEGKGRIAPQAALVAIETKGGMVRALVGGTSFFHSPYNRASQARRPAGSTFKPFLYSAALQQGFQPDSIIEDSPITISGKAGKPWRPRNYGDKYMGKVSLTTALTHSLNTASVRLMQKVGYKGVHTIARKAGITGEMSKALSLSLGTVDLSLLELTGAYQIFANNGLYHPPKFIEKIVFPSGREFYPHQRPVRVLSVAVAEQMQTMLASVVANGTGRAVRDVPGVGGGKTGTSNNSRDAWFIGYDRKYTAGVWVGHDRNQSMGGASGGATAAPIWRQFMLAK